MLCVGRKTPGVFSRRQGVYRLADDGLNARQIAVELGKSVGEIELILALRKK